jgi:hypothetical protein
MGRINVDLPDELEKQLRFKAVERFGGKKGDLSKAVEEAVRTWVDKKELILRKLPFPTRHKMQQQHKQGCADPKNSSVNS